MPRLIPIVFLLMTLTQLAIAMPQDKCGGECKNCHTLSVKEANELLKGLESTVKQVKVPEVRGLWEVDVEKEGKAATIYVDYGKKHVIPGPIFNIATRKPIGTLQSSQEAKGANKVNIATIPLANSVVMGNPKAKKKLFVFTDPDCPFCGKLHVELKKLVAIHREVAVYVKLFPLKMHPQAYDKSRAIMEGASSKLLDDNFAGVKLPAPAQKSSARVIDENIELAKKLGISATPTLVLPDGRVMPGFKPVEELGLLVSGKGGKK